MSEAHPLAGAYRIDDLSERYPVPIVEARTDWSQCSSGQEQALPDGP